MEKRDVSSPSIHLLIIDDISDNRQLLRLDLEDEIPDIHIDEAAAGKEGLQMLAERDYEIVICDILMPGMDGFEVLARARELPAAQGTPFLFLSALQQRETIRRGLELGAVDFLTKPYDIDELVNKVRNLARIKRLQTELEHSRRELLSANAHLHDLNEEKNRVLRIVSHDLRSPLSGIRGLSKILKEEDDAEDPTTVRDFAEVIMQTAEELSRLVNDLLNIAKFESDAESLMEITEFSADELARHSIRRFRPLALHKQLELNYHCEKDIQVLGDHPKLLQVVNNLLSNAIKYTKSGGSVTVMLEGFERDSVECARFTFKDNGIGIPEKFIPNLFQKFGEHQRIGTAGEKGVGLGLPLVKSFVQLHKGSIDIESAEGQGANIAVTIPRLYVR